MKHGFNIYNIRTKLVLAVSLVIISGSVTTLLLFYNFTSNYLAEKIADSTTEQLNKYSNIMNAYLEEAYYQAVRIATEQRFAQAAADVADDAAERASTINSILMSEAEKSAIVDSIYYYSERDKTVITSYNISPSERIENAGEYPWIAIAENPFGKMGDSYNISVYEDRIGLISNRYVSVSKTIYRDSGAMTGVLSVNMKENTIYANFFYNIAGSDGSEVKMVSPSGTIISSSSTESNYKNITQAAYYETIRSNDSGYFVDEVDGISKLVVFVTHPLSEYKLIYTIPFAAITSGVVYLRNLAFLLSFLGISISVSILYFISNEFYKPILKMKGVMKDFEEGRFDVRIEEVREDEFRLLYKGFNNMAEGVEELMDKIVEQRLRINQVNYKILQTQMTPHFIYNTLYSIKCAAMLHKDKTTTEMLSAFIELLQISTDNKVDLIPLETEIKQLDNYVLLQKHRYQDVFDIEYDIDAHFLKKMVPKLILQPLVENSLKYGIDLKKGGGKITLSAYDTDDGFRVEVTDNGTHADMTRIEEILSSESYGDFSEIGISNVNQRLKLIYGQAFGIHYTLDQQKGLTAVVDFGSNPIANYDKI